MQRETRAPAGHDRGDIAAHCRAVDAEFMGELRLEPTVEPAASDNAMRDLHASILRDQLTTKVVRATTARAAIHLGSWAMGRP